MADIKKPQVDAVLIGFGWMGAIMGMELTEAGLKVVALERGEIVIPLRTFPIRALPDRTDLTAYAASCFRI